MSNKRPPAWAIKAEIELMDSMKNLSIGTASSIAVTFEKLIAKHAPDYDTLLAALNTIAYEPIGHSEASHAEVLQACVDIARAAIAKAKGQP